MIRKYSNIDELYKDKFKDFELYPPDHIWENIKQQIPKPDSGKIGKNFSTGGIIGVTIILILSSVITIYLLQNKSYISYDNNVKKTIHSSDHLYHSVPRSVEKSTGQTTKPSVLLAESGISEPKNIEKLESRFELTSRSSTLNGKTNLSVNPTKSQEDIIAEEKIEINNPNALTNSEITTNTPFNNLPDDDSELLAITDTQEPMIKSKPGRPSEDSTEPLSELILVDESSYSPEPNPEFKSDYGKNTNWLFGLYLTPEIVFYPSVSDYNSHSYSIDANVIYRFSGYTIQSGIGAGWLSDNGNYKVDYNKYMGSYEDVYDITFDTTGGQMTPIYHTETVNVYDTIDHISRTSARRHFTYLNVPVLFGYGNEGRRFGWFIKAGPSFSLLINENIQDSPLSESQNKILNPENEISGRLKTNWQFVLTGGASYKLNNSLSFTVEPVFRYYLKSTHEAGGTISTKTPYSLGLRVGLLLGF